MLKYPGSTFFLNCVPMYRLITHSFTKSRTSDCFEHRKLIATWFISWKFFERTCMNFHKSSIHTYSSCSYSPRSNFSNIFSNGNSITDSATLQNDVISRAISRLNVDDTHCFQSSHKASKLLIASATKGTSLSFISVRTSLSLSRVIFQSFIHSNTELPMRTISKSFFFITWRLKM